MEEVNRRIAADLLIELLRAKKISPGGVAGRDEMTIDATVKLFHSLLLGISSDSSAANLNGPT